MGRNVLADETPLKYTIPFPFRPNEMHDYTFYIHALFHLALAVAVTVTRFMFLILYLHREQCLYHYHYHYHYQHRVVPVAKIVELGGFLVRQSFQSPFQTSVFQMTFM